MEDRPGREGSRVALGRTRAGRYLRVIYVPDPAPDYSWREVQTWAADTLRPVLHEMIEIRPLITATLRLDDIQKAYREASENPNPLKVVIKP